MPKKSCMENSGESVSLNIPDSSLPRVVVVGAGFGGVNLVKKLIGKGFQIVLFDKHNYHTFQPLLYQVATSALEADSIAGPVREIFSNSADFYFRMLKVLRVHPEINTISTSVGDLVYDHLIFANGTKANYFGNDEARDHCFPLKFVKDALNFRSQWLQVLERAVLTTNAGEKKSLMTIVMVGGGPTGVEMAGALAELRRHSLPKDYPDLDFSIMEIYLVEGAAQLLPTMSAQSGANALKVLQKTNVQIRLNAIVETYDGKLIKLKNGETIEASTVVWSAGVTGDIVPGLPETSAEKGRLLTNEQCLVKGFENIYAIGDIAAMKSDKWPKGHPGVAQPAIQMGHYLGRHLPALHRKEQVPGFSYFDKGNLATIGRGKAVADLPKNIHLHGRPAWWIWLFIHITYLVSFRNRLLVMANWIWNYFTFQKGNRLIIRPFIRKDDTIGETIFATNEKDF